jgi:hypothetical protein
MPRRPITRSLMLGATLGGALCFSSFALAAPTYAHNAGHFVLPSGECHEVGSFRDAPLVGADGHQLDLVAETPNPPFDEYGTSFVGYWGNTPILPGGCPR